MNEPFASPLFMINFLHPASGATLSYVAACDGKVDLGTVASHFGIEPNTVRFNNHFISRDSNFISSITWRQLLNFFESRGFSSGRHQLSPIHVEGYPLSQKQQVLPPKQGPDFVLGQVSGKRIVAASVQEEPTIPPVKRPKKESNSVSEFSSTPKTPESHKPKRTQEDASYSCLWGKRFRHDPNSDTKPNFQISEEPNNLKRRPAWDEVTTERGLWKRMKEISV